MLACALVIARPHGRNPRRRPLIASPSPRIPATNPRTIPGKPRQRHAAHARGRSRWTTYSNCLKKFIADQRAIVDAAMKAGNDAVEEYNAVVTKAQGSDREGEGLARNRRRSRAIAECLRRWQRLRRPLPPPLPPTPIASAPAIARVAARRLRPPLRAVPRVRARRQAPLRGRQLARDRPRRARPHRLLRPPRAETVERIEREFALGRRSTARRRRAVGAREAALHRRSSIDHKQPECAETFFNSVSCKILHRGYFHNRFIFVRPAIVHRAHRRRPAVVSQLLPAAAADCARR